MKFSENWLRSVCSTTFTTDELSNALTMAGLEVESVEPVAKNLKGVVVGRITHIRPHPNADKLKICDIDVGESKLLQIVCGAPNAAEGMKVPTALVNAQLPSGLVIKRANFKGELSLGMLCSGRELDISDDDAGLMSLATDLAVGTDIRDVFDLNDNVFMLKLTANRGDCLSIMGIAREVQAISGVTVQYPKVEEKSSIGHKDLSITIADEKACPLYCGLTIRGINSSVKTPPHILQKLERSGIRGIRAIVDLTNYVMLELGQPMHAFDRDKLKGNISVRYGRVGEVLGLLNGQQLAISEDMQMISDDSGPVALAGIMGGELTAVDDETTNIFLEAAVFSIQSVAGKWRSLGFSTDALHRFERGVDPQGSRRALWRLANLITEICGGSVESFTETGSSFVERRGIVFRPERVHRLIGIDVSVERMRQILERLEMSVSAEGDAFLVVPPSYRFDIELEEDLIEEIVRIEGFNKLPSTLPRSEANMIPTREWPDWDERIKRVLIQQGFQEVITYSFVDKLLENDFSVVNGVIPLANPIAEQYSVMRTNLLGSLALVLQRNISHRIERVRIFESSLCFERSDSGEIIQYRKVAGMISGSSLPEQWAETSRTADFFDLKGDLENILKTSQLTFGITRHKSFHPGKVASIVVNGEELGVLGELHPELSQKYDLDANTVAFELNIDALPESSVPQYRAFSRVPAVRRDVAFEVAADMEVEQIISCILTENIRHLSDVTLFDIYLGKGIAEQNKSVALAIMFQNEEKTLTDEEVEESVAQVFQLVELRFNATRRI
ncbi:MAG: phenylalanine--tRNA ligase subunit beta [Proteobacteria bacterium]|nr:phenylalanine--tRNA ligase subunit beta [Pseudomonadota bacterium]MDA1332264.1 phenylalanine--tRNA ligase subunit beta [Pseudomonadota bacterium]